MEIKAAEQKSTTEHSTGSLSLPSLTLLRGVIILNGAPCYAISAVKLLKKWIIDGEFFGSISEQCGVLIYMRLLPQPELNHGHYPATQDPSQDLHRPLSTPAFDREDRPFFQRIQPYRDTAESKRKRDVYIREKKRHRACGYNYTQAAQWWSQVADLKARQSECKKHAASLNLRYHTVPALLCYT